MDFGIFSPYTCPECHGVLSSLQEGDILRFRCHTGHAFTAQSLLAAIVEQSEEHLWSAIRSMQESIVLLNHLGDHLAEANQPKLAAAYFQKAKATEERVKQINQVVLNNGLSDTDAPADQAPEPPAKKD